MMKRTVAALLILSLSVFAGCRREPPAPTDGANASLPDSSATAPTADTSAPALTNAGLVLSSRSYNKTFTLSGAEILDVFISFPKLEYGNDPALRLIDEYYEDMLSGDKEYAETQMRFMAEDEYNYCASSGNVFRKCSSTVNYGVRYNKRDYLSVTLETLDYFGGASSSLYVRAHTFDLRTGELLTLDALFSAPYETYYPFISDAIAAQITKDGSETYWDNWRDALDSAESISGFYLGEDGVTFFFQPGDLAALAYGVISFEIPYSDFSGMLALRNF